MTPLTTKPITGHAIKPVTGLPLGISSNGYAAVNAIAGSQFNPNSATSMHVLNDAKFDGNIIWQGRDLGKVLETIEKRLMILTPDPKKLEKFEALQKAYNNYILLENLCNDDDH